MRNVNNASPCRNAKAWAQTKPYIKGTMIHYIDRPGDINQYKHITGSQDNVVFQLIITNGTIIQYMPLKVD